MRIALAQINPTVGDIAGNLQKHLAALRAAKDQGAQIILFPELSVIGYPPKDLLLKPIVITQCETAVQAIAAECSNITAIVGTVLKNPEPSGRPLFNAVCVLSENKIIATRRKSLLPTYDVFDESRYFEPGADTELTPLLNQSVGISICEDLWNDEKFLERPLYHFNPIGALAQAGAKILFNISASPFILGKNEYRHQLFSFQAKRWNMPIVYVNQVGGNDELVFDGNSVVFDAGGKILAQGKDFEEDLLIVDLPADPLGPQSPVLNTPRSGIASIHAALILGLRDYVQKCGFKSVVLGLSGGIDSAVVAALAAQALGSQNVLGVALPSRYSSDHSKSDAFLLAENLRIRCETISIEGPHAAMEAALAPIFNSGKTQDSGLAAENIQARLRGNILMALSNKFGHMLLTTGNKSEVAVGYCTLYGDMCGGLAVISDLPKMMVYELARFINAQARSAGHTPPIPDGTLTKPPSAELKPGQKDQDSLPPYDLLDAIIEMYVEEEKSAADIIQAGFALSTVARILRLIDLSEYKRKQMPPGIKVTSRAFGFGRRMPIAQRFDGNPALVSNPANYP